MIRRLGYSIILAGTGLLGVLLVWLVIKLVDWIIDGNWIMFGLAFLILVTLLYAGEVMSERNRRKAEASSE